MRAGSLLLGLAGMAVLTWVNVRGIKASGRTQDALVVVLLVMATLFIGAGIVRGDASNLEPWFQRSASGSVWPGVLALFMTASFWFGGFNVIPVMMEEKAHRTSFRRVGWMIVLAIVIGIVFKTSVILSAAMTTPWPQLMEMEIPVATALERAFGSVVMGKLVLVAALLGLLSTWNAMFVCGSRLLFALGRSHLVHPAMGRVHRTHGSPASAILFVGAAGAVVTLLGRNAILPIVNAASSCLALSYLVTCVAVVRLRRSRPDAERPFRVPGACRPSRSRSWDRRSRSGSPCTSRGPMPRGTSPSSGECSPRGCCSGRGVGRGVPRSRCGGPGDAPAHRPGDGAILTLQAVA